MLDEELDAMLKEYEEKKSNEEKNYQKELLEREEKWHAWIKENNTTLHELMELVDRWDRVVPDDKKKAHYLVPETQWAVFLPQEEELGLGLNFETRDSFLHYLVIFPNQNPSYLPRVYEARINVLCADDLDKFHLIDTCTLIANDIWWSRVCKYMEGFDKICEQTCKWMKGKLKDFQRRAA